MDAAFEWDFVSLFEPRKETSAGPDPDGHAILVLNHTLENSGIFQVLWANASMHVAADGGANRIHDLPTPPSPPTLDLIVGDLDSIRPEVQSFYASCIPATQIVLESDDSLTDFAKAVHHIRSAATLSKPCDIVVLGGLGGRVDQALSVLHYMYALQDSAYRSGRLYLVGPGTLTVLLQTGRHRVRVRGSSGTVFGKSVGIIPLKERSVITTHGLQWDVRDWETEIGGAISTSNAVSKGVEVVEIETTKDVLFTVDTLDLVDGI